jgi:4-hydroxy-3-methylbut-2-enyl diphosphate reductase
MIIKRAENMGFCFGVENAVSRTLETVMQANGDVYAVGPIIHNSFITKDLRKKGLITVDSIDEVPDGQAIVIRSHGETKEFYEKASQKGLKVVDTTCPNVKRIHDLVSQADVDGKTVVIVGDEDHPEVVGIKSRAKNPIIINSLYQAMDINSPRVFVVVQTTYDSVLFSQIEEILRQNLPDIQIHNTICDATLRRQNSCKALASQVDMMIIIGDSKSSNSRKLFKISKKICKNTVFIENIDSLSLQDVWNYNTIGITAGASTPERIIKEVIAKMSDVKTEQEMNPMHAFMDEIDKSLRLPRNGEVITGEVIQVSDKDVIISIGAKKDGIIPRDEITLEEGQTMFDAFKEGDEVQAKVLKNDDGDGNILMSKKRVVINEHWEEINQAMEDGTPMEVKVTREVNGGVIAVYNEIYGFIPLSQLSDRYVEKADEFVGQTLTVRVTRVDQKRNKVVFSHKAVLNEQKAQKMEEIWEALNVDDVIPGRVMRFTDYGAFVDIGGIDGLLHISEISWGKLKHPQEVLELNQEIQVKILSMNKEKEKISLGYKQNQPEPWTIINDKYEVGQIISGKAVQLKDYGVFVELEPGLDGLVHIYEIAHKRVNDINDEITVGQDITAKILEIDQDRKRISLSIKETLDKDAEDMDADEDDNNDDNVVEETAVDNAPEVAEETPADDQPEEAEEEAPADAPEETEAAEEIAESEEKED